MKTEDTEKRSEDKLLNQARSNAIQSTDLYGLQHMQYWSTETVMLMFPFLQTNLSTTVLVYVV